MYVCHHHRSPPIVPSRPHACHASRTAKCAAAVPQRLAGSEATGPHRLRPARKPDERVTGGKFPPCIHTYTYIHIYIYDDI